MRNPLSFVLCLAMIGCGGGASSDPKPEAPPPEYRIAVLLDRTDPLPELEFAVAEVQAAGGVAGGTLHLEYVGLEEARNSDGGLALLAAQLAARDDIQAAVGLTRPEDMLAMIPAFEARGKPVISFSATGGEVARAFAGSLNVWRTKLSDLAQVSLLVTEARRLDARKLKLVTPADGVGETFFNWFGFFATDLQFAQDQVSIEVYGDNQTCADAMAAAIEGGVDYLVFVPAGAEDLSCLADGIAALPPVGGASGLQVMVADTGMELDPILKNLGQGAMGLQGWRAAPADREVFTAAWTTHFGEQGMPSNAAAAYDAILLLAYGIEASAGEPGKLGQGIVSAVAGDGTRFGWTAEGIKLTLEAIRLGVEPDVDGPGGTLSYDVGGVDPTRGTVERWAITLEGKVVDEVRVLGDEQAERVARARAPGMEGFEASTGAGAYTPAAAAQRLVAVVLSSSSGWSNYRHQADALAVYQRIRSAGVGDEDIVMVGADDLAENDQNALPGVVRNLVGGPNVREDTTYDYGLELTAPETLALLTADDGGPLALNASTNLLVYLVGHGGTKGLALGANTTEAGVNADDGVMTPDMLREALCTLRRADRVRRVLVVIESCHSGVFGEAEFGGLEAGCDDGEPLEGVALITAANPDESSFGTGYDSELGAWVGDEFSVALGDLLDDADNLSNLYRDLYLAVPGSHVSLYNGDHFGGALSSSEVAEYFSAP